MQAARLSVDTELYLYLAQLLIEQRDWQALNKTMLAACDKQLEDRFVGRANVYLGISQLKLGDEAGARRSFINATLITGANVQAGQWLEHMEAAPPTRDEARQIVGICYGSMDKQLETDGSGSGVTTAKTDPAPDGGFVIREIAPQRIFYREYTMPLTELAEQVRSLVVRMNVALVKAGGSVVGPVHIIAGEQQPEGGEPSWRLALPVSGSPQGKGQYRVGTAPACRCATMTATGEGRALLDDLERFSSDVRNAGHLLTGEGRLVVLQTPDNDVSLEFQLGIE